MNPSKPLVLRLEPFFYWAVLIDEQMSNGWPVSLQNDEQMSKKGEGRASTSLG